MYGYRSFEDTGAQQEFRAFLAARAWSTTEGSSKLFDRTAAWLVQHKLLLPGITILAKRVAEVRAEQAQRLYTTVAPWSRPNGPASWSSWWAPETGRDCRN